MKHVLILENNCAEQEALEKIVRELNADVVIHKADTVAAAYQIAVEHVVSLFLVDIVIDSSIRSDVSGLKFVESIRKLDRYAFAPVIFITALTDPRLYAYSTLHCYGYFEKPALVKELTQSIRQALKYQPPKVEEGTLYFRKDGVIYAAEKEKIVYIKSHGGSISIKTEYDEFTVFYRSCKDILSELDSDLFIRINRGIIVNSKYIANADLVNRVLHLVNGYGDLEISVRMRKNILEKLKSES